MLFSCRKSYKTFPGEILKKVSWSSAKKNEEVKIQIAEDGLIVSVNKAIDPAIARGEAVGINKFSPGFWGVFSEKLKILKDGFANEYFEYALERSISAKNSILPYYIHQNIAMEIDFPDDLKNAKKFLV